MGIACVIWGGLGRVGVVLIGVWQVIGMMLIAVGTVLLNAVKVTTI